MSNKSKNKKIFSENLRELLERSGKKQTDLAKYIEERTGKSITRQAVGQWCCGKTSPSLEIVPIIADFFGVSTDYFLIKDGVCKADGHIMLSERLKETRIKLKMSMEDLAKKTGITASEISSYEATEGEKSKVPSLINAMRLASALGVSLDWLSGLDNLKCSYGETSEATAERVLVAAELIVNPANNGLCKLRFSLTDREKYHE